MKKNYCNNDKNNKISTESSQSIRQQETLNYNVAELYNFTLYLLSSMTT